MSKSSLQMQDYGTVNIKINDDQNTQQTTDSYTDIETQHTQNKLQRLNRGKITGFLLLIFLILCVVAAFRYKDEFYRLGNVSNNFKNILNHSDNNNAYDNDIDTWILQPTDGINSDDDCVSTCNNICAESTVRSLDCDKLCETMNQFCYNSDGSAQCSHYSDCLTGQNGGSKDVTSKKEHEMNAHPKFKVKNAYKGFSGMLYYN